MSSLVVVPAFSNAKFQIIIRQFGKAERLFQFIHQPDGVASSHSNPLRHRAVLFLLNTKGALDLERLVGRLKKKETTREDQDRDYR